MYLLAEIEQSTVVPNNNSKIQFEENQNEADIMRNLLAIFILICACSSRTNGYKFAVQKKLNGGEILSKNLRTNFEVTGGCAQNPGDKVSISVEMSNSVLIRHPNVSVFLANEHHNVLKIEFLDQVKLTYYKFPYNVVKSVAGSDLISLMSPRVGTFTTYFPNSWLPKNISKISGALEFPDGEVYNYYGVKNYLFSIRDLMVLEEYRKFDCNA